MKVIFLSFLFGMGNLAYALDGSKTLIGKDKLSSKVKNTQHQVRIELDDTFLVQSFGKLKSLNIRNQDIQQMYDFIFAKEFLSALKVVPTIKTNSYKEQRLIKAGELYLLHKLGFRQSFFNLWVREATKHNLLISELGVALDQIIAPTGTNNLINHGIIVTKPQKLALLKLDQKDSIYNNSVQAYLKLKQGDEGLKALELLEKGDKFIYPLAKSVVTDLALKGKLADAGHIVKTYIEPIIDKSEGVDQIAEYYIMLARLLYQAKAYDSARDYYLKVPDESKFFLNARVEALWISMRNEDHSVILGEVKSLDHFKEEYLPERYLVAAMAHLKLCQFQEVQNSLKKYVETNKSFSKLIAKNLESSELRAFPQYSFYRELLQNGISSIESEMSDLKELNLLNTKALIPQYELAKSRYNQEVRLEWENKKKLIEKSLRKMRFVKIEFLSTMRRLKNQVTQNQDTVSSFTSGIDKTGKLEFPYDGILFGDELFHLYSKVQALCLGEQK